MDTILTGSRFDIRNITCIMMNVIAPQLEYGEAREGNTKFVKQLETVQMTAD